MAIFQWATAVAFALLGVLALRMWRRHGTTPAGWAAAAFGLLGSALLVSRLVPDDAAPGIEVAQTVVSAIGILAFPYLLFRFTASFGQVSAIARRAAAVAAGVVVGGTVALVPLFAPAPTEPAWFTLLLVVIVVYWTVLSAWVAARLWRAGRGRPTVARRRMRALAASSGLLNVALVAAVFLPGDTEATTVATQMLAIASAAGFYLALSPPGFLRREWRRREERTLRGAPLDVLRADSHAAAAETVLPRVASLFGANRALFVDADAQPLATLGVSADELPRAAARLRSTTERHTVEQHGDWIVLRLGTGWLGVGADPYAPFFDSEERELFASVGALIDLALERVDLLAAERESKARVEAASREVEGLLYGISHDLRNPLVSLLGYLEVLEADAGDALDEDSRHYIDRLRANAHYMDALIGDLLELSRVGRTQRGTEAVALQPLVEEVAAELRRAHPAATVEVRDLPVIDMNAVRARQLFANLIGNALKHGGRADITVSVTASRSEGAHREIVVADDGKGIPEPYRERVFRIFERLESTRDAHGTGIGLAMCQRIVEQAGGRIWIGDAAVGTSVHVELPAPDEARGTLLEVGS